LQLRSDLIGLIIVFLKWMERNIWILFCFHDFFWNLSRGGFSGEKLLLIVKVLTLLNFLSCRLHDNILWILVCFLFRSLSFFPFLFFLNFVICNRSNRVVLNALLFYFMIWALFRLLNTLWRRLFHIGNRLISRNFDT
jgi:hypothetical protein